MAGGLTSGVVGIAGAQGYLNGSADGGALPAGSGTNSNPLWIGNRSNGAAPFAGNIQALAVYNRALSAAEVAAVTLAMQTLWRMLNVEC